MAEIGLNEHEVMRIKKHWMFFFGWPFVITVIGFLPTAGLILFFTGPFLLYRCLYYRAEQIVLTNKQFHVRTGLLSKEVTSTPLTKINNVSYEQSFVGRILGYGTITIYSATAFGTVYYSYIKDPNVVAGVIEQTLNSREEAVR